MTRGRFDLADRLLSFAVATCRLVEELPGSPVGRHVAVQLIRCSSSPAANYAEAQGAESRKDFVHKLRIRLKELRETRMWLRFLDRMELMDGKSADSVVRECEELLAILATSVRTANKPSRR